MNDTVEGLAAQFQEITQTKDEYSSILRERDLKIKADVLGGNINVLMRYVLGYEVIQFHHEMLQFQSSNDKTLCMAARGSGKSSALCIVRAIFELLLDPNIRILIVSNTQTQSEVFLREIKSHFENNQNLIRIFGNMVGSKWDSKEIDVRARTTFAKESNVTCLGVGSGVIGRHYDLIICCRPDVEVMTRKGAKKIEDVKTTDLVQTHRGRYRRVDEIHSRDYHGPMFYIKAYKSCGGIWVTPNHPILVRRLDENNLPHVKYISAQDIKLDDYLVYPRRKHDNAHNVSKFSDINSLLKANEFWRLVGYWLAEGSANLENSGNHRLRWTFGTNDNEGIYVEDCLDCIEYLTGIRPKTNIYGSVAQISITNRLLNIIASCGRLQNERRLPYWIMNTSLFRFRELLRAYWRGDGHSITRNNITTTGFVSVSKNLLLDIKQCLIDFKIMTTVRILRESMSGVIVCGNTVNQKDTYTLYGHEDLSEFLDVDYTRNKIKPNKCRYFFDDNYIYSKVREIKTEDYSGLVYNLEVNEDHTYCHDGIVSHNCDDLVDEENSRTDTQREKFKIWYYKVLDPCLEPHGRIYMHGTRYYPSDHYGHLIKADDEYTHKVWPAWEEVEVGKGLGPDKNLVSIWEDKLSVDWLLKKKKAAGNAIFATQYLNNTDSMEGKIFNYNDFKFYKNLPDELTIYQGCDLAISKAESADSFVIVTIGRDRFNNIFVIDVFASKLTFMQQTEMIEKKYHQFKPMRVFIESNAYQAAQVQVVLATTEVRARPILTIKDKVTRAWHLAHRFEVGQVFFPEYGCQDFIEQLLEFPDAQHDDLVDAFMIAVEGTKKRKKVREEFGVI